jgi:hypothetical protein
MVVEVDKESGSKSGENLKRGEEPLAVSHYYVISRLANFFFL